MEEGVKYQLSDIIGILENQGVWDYDKVEMVILTIKCCPIMEVEKRWF